MNLFENIKLPPHLQWLTNTNINHNTNINIITWHKPSNQPIQHIPVPSASIALGTGLILIGIIKRLTQ